MSAIFAVAEVVVAKYKRLWCKRCGCVRKKRYVDRYYACTVCLYANAKTYRQRNWMKYLVDKANKRKRPGSQKLTVKDVEKIWRGQGEVCALTGCTLSAAETYWRPSIDRIDNSKGYSKNNIRIVAWICNRIRGELLTEEFIEMCQKVTQYHSETV